MKKNRLSEAASKRAAAAPLNEFDVARMTGMSIQTVRRWRLLGQGPKYMKFRHDTGTHRSSAAVRYRPEDVEEWMSSRLTCGERRIASAG
jgi:predicted DNA-binding transcriptional regulator AlpA